MLVTTVLREGRRDQQLISFAMQLAQQLEDNLNVACITPTIVSDASNNGLKHQ